METSLSDSRLHADDVSPEDIWGEPAFLQADVHDRILPPKRMRAENHASDADEGGMGLRIGDGLSTHAAGQPQLRMEVLEIVSNVVRLNPEIATEPWAPRQFLFQQRAPTQNGMHSGETREWGKPKKQPFIWIFGSGVAVLALVVWAVMMIPSIDQSTAARPQSGDPALVLEPDGMNAQVTVIKDMLARQKEAEKILHALVAAPAVADILPMLRDAQNTVGLIRPHHHLIGRFVNQPAPMTGHWTALDKEGLTYGLLKGTLPDYSDFEAYFVMEEGRLVLDWKASVAYGSADFTELARKCGNPAEIRAWISNAGFYTLAFPEQEFQCHKLLSPDRQQSVWAYSRRSSKVESYFSARLKGGYILPSESQSMKVTVRLEAGPAAALPNQWLIGELLHKDWITP